MKSLMSLFKLVCAIFNQYCISLPPSLSPLLSPLSHSDREGGASVCSASGSEDSGWSSSSDEESEALYHKRYIFAKKMAKSIIYVRTD